MQLDFEKSLLDAMKDASPRETSSSFIAPVDAPFLSPDKLLKGIPLIAGSLWTIWTFMYKEYIAPQVRREPLASGIEILSINQKSNVGLPGSFVKPVVLTSRILIRNKTSNRLRLPSPFWVVYGFKVTRALGEKEIAPMLKTGMFNSASSVGLMQKRSLVNVGRIMVATVIESNQELAYVFPILVDSSRYDYLEIRVFVNGLRDNIENNRYIERWFASDRTLFNSKADIKHDVGVLTGLCKDANPSRIKNQFTGGTIGSALFNLRDAFKYDYRDVFSGKHDSDQGCHLLFQNDDHGESNFVAVQTWVGEQTKKSPSSSLTTTP